MTSGENTKAYALSGALKRGRIGVLPLLARRLVCTPNQSLSKRRTPVSRYIALDVHAESTTCAVLSSTGKRLKQEVVADHGAADSLSSSCVLEETGGVRPEETHESHRRGFVGSSPAAFSAPASLRRQPYEEEHPPTPWPLRSPEQALLADYASSEYRTKSWPNEAQLEGWCPSFRGEHRRFKAATEPTSSRNATSRQTSPVSAAANTQPIFNHDRPDQTSGAEKAEPVLTPTLPRRCRP